jgi:hypothetical protein
MPAKNKIVDRLLEQLDLAARLRESAADEPDAEAGRQCLRAWQAQRLTRTHADLLANPRFRETALFFLTDLYGPEDLSRHESDVRRILPIMTRVLPVAGLETVADAVELNTLSETLDAAMVSALGSEVARLDEAAYGLAYRAVGRRPERERQIDLIEHLGRSLDHLTQQPFVGKALSMMRKPAKLAGLGELQHFLERGYTAFRKMGGADEFLQIVMSKERALLEALFAGDDNPLKSPCQSKSA